MGIPAVRRSALGVALSVALSSALRGAAPAAQEPPQPEPTDLTELDLEQLMEVEIGQVYGASRHLQRTLDAPSSVTVVNGDEIRARGYRTLLEVLRSITGLHTSNDRNYAYLAVRGFYVPGDYNSRVLLLVDGRRVNDAVYGGIGLGFDSIVDPELIDRIEVIRGPGSALYGSNAMLAVVNVITQRGSQRAGVEAALEGGADDTYLAHLTAGGQRASGLEWLITARGYTSDGSEVHYDEFASTPSGGTTDGRDYEDAYSYAARVDGDSWSFDAGYVWREKGIPTGSYDTIFDADNYTIDAEGHANFTWRPDVGEKRNALLHASYSDYRYWAKYVYDDTANGGPPQLPLHDTTVATTLALDAQLGLEETLGGTLTLGSELRWNIEQDQESWDYLYGDYVDDQRDSLEWALFAQDEIELGRRTTLVAGGRVDEYESYGAHFSPRLAVVHRPDDASALKLLYGEAFRAPNAYERFYQSSTLAAQPDLDPESMATLEAAGERWFDGGLRLAAALFHYQIDDLIAQSLDPGSGELVFANQGEVTGGGIEFELEKRFAGGTLLGLSQSLQEVEDADTGDRVPNSPKHVTQAHLDAPLFAQRLRAALEVIYVGSRPTIAGDTADAYVLTNLAVRAPELWKGVELALIARNLFDVEYSDPVGPDLIQDQLEQDGFSLALRLTVRR